KERNEHALVVRRTAISGGSSSRVPSGRRRRTLLRFPLGKAGTRGSFRAPSIERPRTHIRYKGTTPFSNRFRRRSGRFGCLPENGFENRSSPRARLLCG